MAGFLCTPRWASSATHTPPAPPGGSRSQGGSGTASQSRTHSAGPGTEAGPTLPPLPCSCAGSARAPAPARRRLSAPAPRWDPVLLGQWPSVPALPAPSTPRGQGRAGRRRVGGFRGRGARGGPWPRKRGPCCRWAGVVVVGVVHRHLLDAEGDAPHHLDLRLPVCPAPLTLWVASFALPTPFRLLARPPCPQCPLSPPPTLPPGPFPAPGPLLFCAPSPPPTIHHIFFPVVGVPCL